MKPRAGGGVTGAGVASASVMSGGERAAFAVLTTVVLIGTAAFGWHWLSLAPAGAARVGFVVVTLIGGFLWTSWFGRWLLLWRMRRPIPMPIPVGRVIRVAAVTTFVPGAEPVGMVEQCARAMVAMDYPHDTWVLDEGNSQEIADRCQRMGTRHFSRAGRPEYLAETGRFARATKYGNYNAWLAEFGADYDILVSFDPDHVPERTFLTRILGYFDDPEVAFVQAPQVYYNQRTSFVASAAAEETYAYYSTHHLASYGVGQSILVGSHSGQRIAALNEVGGFAAHDADDLLITMRYRAAGWQGVFVPEILALGLTPARWPDYLRQQLRWSRSVVDLKLKQLPAFASRLSPIEWLLNLFHGVFYLRSLVLPVLYALVATLIVVGAAPKYLSAPALGLAAAFGLLVGVAGRLRYRFYLDRARESAVPWRSFVLQLAKWPYQGQAVWAALASRPVSYEITVKVHSSDNRKLALWPHWVVAAAMTVALTIGFRVHGTVALPLAVIAVAVIGFSIGAPLMEILTKAPRAWDPTVYRDRRAELSDLLGPIS